MRIMPFMKRKKGIQFAGTGLDTGGGGVTDYDDLLNKPQIGGVTLTGNKTLADLGAQSVLTFDNVPTANSGNPVKSGGVYSELSAVNSKIPDIASWQIILTESTTKIYIHKDVVTSSRTVPKWIRLVLSTHGSYGGNTVVAEYLIRLNYTPYQDAAYRGLGVMFIAGMSNTILNYDMLNTFGWNLGWDAGGIYIEKVGSDYQNYGAVILVESPFGISAKPEV